MKEQSQVKRRETIAREADVIYDGGLGYVVIGPETEEPSPSLAHQQFLAAVEQAMEGPFIRYSKRLQLMELAKTLRISRFQANLLVAQVLQRAGGIVPDLSDPYESTMTPSVEPVIPKTDWRERFFLFAAFFIVAALIELALLRFVFVR